MDSNKKPTQQGITLIELLLYVGIMGILLGALASFLALTLTSQVKNQSVSEVNQQGAFAMQYMTRVIRNADTITQPTAGGTSSVLTATVSTPAESPTVFSLNAGRLQVQEGASTAIPLTSDKVAMSGLTFKNLTPAGGNTVIQVTFTLGRNSVSQLQEYSYQKVFVGSAEKGW